MAYRQETPKTGREVRKTEWSEPPGIFDPSTEIDERRSVQLSGQP